MVDGGTARHRSTCFTYLKNHLTMHCSDQLKNDLELIMQFNPRNDSKCPVYYMYFPLVGLYLGIGC